MAISYVKLLTTNYPEDFIRGEVAINLAALLGTEDAVSFFTADRPMVVDSISYRMETSEDADSGLDLLQLDISKAADGVAYSSAVAITSAAAELTTATAAVLHELTLDRTKVALATGDTLFVAFTGDVDRLKNLQIIYRIRSRRG